MKPRHNRRSPPGRTALVLLPLLLAAAASAAPPDMVPVEGGTFLMQEADWEGVSVGSAQEVTVDSFLIARFEITLAEWRTVRAWAGTNGYHFVTGSGCAPDHPVQRLNWHDALKWCNALSEMNGRPPAYQVESAPYREGTADAADIRVDWHAGYRLPTEAEWEFAARGGFRSRGYAYSGSDDPDAVAWHVGTAAGAACGMVAQHGTWPVGLKAPNELGVHDMSGNVWEWCWDWRADYEPGTRRNPRGPGTGTHRVVRGGGWMAGAPHCHVAFRSGIAPETRDCLFGLRPVLPAPPEFQNKSQDH